MTETSFQVDTPEQFKPVVEHVLQTAREVTDGAAIVTLSGDLGAGKTTFTQQLAAQLGVTETVVSPTFGIMKVYEVEGDENFDQLVHIDAYRIEDISEVTPLRFLELWKESRTLICIEWPEQIAEMLPKQKLMVSISIVDGEVRKVIVT